MFSSYRQNIGIVYETIIISLTIDERFLRANLFACPYFGGRLILLTQLCHPGKGYCTLKMGHSEIVPPVESNYVNKHVALTLHSNLYLFMSKVFLRSQLLSSLKCYFLSWFLTQLKLAWVPLV